jgi:ribosome recycling factor
MEEIEFIIDEAKDPPMNGSIAHLEKHFLNIRAGKASTSNVRSVFVDYYGSQHHFQVVNLNVPDARTRLRFSRLKSMLQTY